MRRGEDDGRNERGRMRNRGRGRSKEEGKKEWGFESIIDDGGEEGEEGEGDLDGSFILGFRIVSFNDDNY